MKCTMRVEDWRKAKTSEATTNSIVYDIAGTGRNSVLYCNFAHEFVPMTRSQESSSLNSLYEVKASTRCLVSRHSESVGQNSSRKPESRGVQDTLKWKLKAGGWARNESRLELVLDKAEEGTGAIPHDAQLKGRIAGSARYLENHCCWNGRNGSELTMRLRAAHRAWISMGRFWTSSRPWGSRRTAFLCSVVGAMTSGAETYD